MEKQTKQLSRDVPVLPVNTSHLRPHDLLRSRTRVAVEIVLQILRRRLREEIVGAAAVDGGERNEGEEWLGADGGGDSPNLLVFTIPNSTTPISRISTALIWIMISLKSCEGYELGTEQSTNPG